MVPPKMEYRHYSTGVVIKRVITGDFRAVYGSPYMRLHRWDLQHAMMMRLAEVHRRTAPRLGIDRLEHGGAGVTLRFTDGHTETADIVVAADGIRSAIREALFNPAPPVFAGFVASASASSPPPFCRSTYINRPSPSGRAITSTGIWSDAASC